MVEDGGFGEGTERAAQGSRHALVALRIGAHQKLVGEAGRPGRQHHGAGVGATDHGARHEGGVSSCRATGAPSAAW